MDVFDHEVMAARVEPKVTVLVPCVDPKFVPVMVTDEPAAPDVGLTDVTLGVKPPPPPAVTLAEKLLIPSPWPPVQISKPISMSISHHVLWRLPRPTASLKKGTRSKPLTEFTPGSRT
jgi:hypothetical protein